MIYCINYKLERTSKFRESGGEPRDIDKLKHGVDFLREVSLIRPTAIVQCSLAIDEARFVGCLLRIFLPRGLRIGVRSEAKRGTEVSIIIKFCRCERKMKEKYVGLCVGLWRPSNPPSYYP